MIRWLLLIVTIITAPFAVVMAGFAGWFQEPWLLLFPGAWLYAVWSTGKAFSNARRYIDLNERIRRLK